MRKMLFEFFGLHVWGVLADIINGEDPKRASERINVEVSTLVARSFLIFLCYLILFSGMQ